MKKVSLRAKNKNNYYKKNEKKYLIYARLIKFVKNVEKQKNAQLSISSGN